MLFSNKIYIKYYLMRLRNNTYHVEKVIRKNKPMDMITHKEMTFKIDLKAPLFVAQNNVCFFLDIETGNQLVFDQIEVKTTPKDLDLIVGQKIIKELTKGVMDNRKEKFLTMLTGFIFGGLLVAIILIMYYNGKINQVYQDVIDDFVSPDIIPL